MNPDHISLWFSLYERCRGVGHTETAIFGILNAYHKTPVVVVVHSTQYADDLKRRIACRYVEIVSLSQSPERLIGRKFIMVWDNSAIMMLLHHYKSDLAALAAEGERRRQAVNDAIALLNQNGHLRAMVEQRELTITNLERERNALRRELRIQESTRGGRRRRR